MKKYASDSRPIVAEESRAATKLEPRTRRERICKSQRFSAGSEGLPQPLAVASIEALKSRQNVAD